jgi:hypothetical protein
VRPAVEAEKAGIPSVVVTVAGFTAVAQAAAKAAGVEDLRLVAYPGAYGVHQSELRENIKKVLFDQIIDGLTREVRGASPRVTNTGWNPKEIVLRGTFEEVNKFFYRNEWTDGLPIIPPTIGRVEEFLKYTDRSADEEVAILPQSNLKAVPRNIAANGVMAGCRPEHMPILVAAVEAIGDEHYNLNNIGTTWGVLPYLLINGPIIKNKQLGIEYAGQLICRGSNPAIGRALGLIIKNIAGYKPGKNYMGTFGYPLVFALAENEDENPWEPYHVEHGFDKNVSTVTAGATITWGWPPSPYSAPEKSAAESSLELLSIELTKKPSIIRTAEQGPRAMKNIIALLLAPPVAKSIAKGGYSKQAIREYLYEKARVPLSELEWLNRYTSPEMETVRQKVKAWIYSEDYLVGPDDRVRVLASPDLVHIVVCGDPNRNRVMTLWGGYAQMTTREIKLPAKWTGLLQEAKD